MPCARRELTRVTVRSVGSCLQRALLRARKPAPRKTLPFTAFPLPFPLPFHCLSTALSWRFTVSVHCLQVLPVGRDQGVRRWPDPDEHGAHLDPRLPAELPDLPIHVPVSVAAVTSRSARARIAVIGQHVNRSAVFVSGQRTRIHHQWRTSRPCNMTRKPQHVAPIHDCCLVAVQAIVLILRVFSLLVRGDYAWLGAGWAGCDCCEWSPLPHRCNAANQNEF